MAKKGHCNCLQQQLLISHLQLRHTTKRKKRSVWVDMLTSSSGTSSSSLKKSEGECAGLAATVSFFGISIKFSWQHKNNVVKIILHLCQLFPFLSLFLQQRRKKHLAASVVMRRRRIINSSLWSRLCRHVLSCLSYQKVQQQSRFQTRTI